MLRIAVCKAKVLGPSELKKRVREELGNAIKLNC
jgi:hypothetical protein